jgi:hypothetical protein
METDQVKKWFQAFAFKRNFYRYNLDGANFEGALLSSSDAQRVCENPTVDDYGRAILGCRGGKK